MSEGKWPVGSFTLRRPGAAGALAVLMVGLGSAFDCVRWGFMNCTKGSNPEFSRWDESREGTETGGVGTNDGLDWTG